MLKKNEWTQADFVSHVNQHYPRWSRATGRVTKIRPFGLFVEFDDGIQGIVRRRELSWTGQADLADVISPGQRLEVVVINTDYTDQRLELSRRLVERDPWQDFVNTAEPGQVIRGQVIRVMPFGAFVEIRPGLVGLVRISEIAPWFVEQVEEVLWVGDQVQAEILTIDPAKRHVALSIKKYLKRLDHEATQATVAAYVSREPGLQLSLGDRLGLSASQLERRVQADSQPLQPVRRRSGKILIVEDEQALASLMEQWLYRLGYRIDTVEAGDAGVELALNGDYKIILMDLNLPGLDGLEAARRILAQHPTTPIALMTGAALADEYGPAIETIGFVDVLLKPFTPAEVETLLERLERDGPLKADYTVSHSQELAAEIGFFQRVSQASEARGDLTQALTQALDEVRVETEATAAAIFALDAVSQAVSLTAHSGVALTFEPHKHHLAESPVKDVALERQVVWEKDAPGRGAARFRYLLPLLDFSSCMGVPIRVHDSQAWYGLFLFHPHAHHFTTHHLQQTLAASVVLGVTLERSQAEQMMRSFQRLFLMGQLSSGLAHEVNNKLASVEFYTSDLLRGFERLQQEQPQLANTFLYRELHRAAETIAAMNRSVLETARMFRALMAGEEPRLMNINEVIEHTLRLMQPLAHKHQVSLKTQLDSDLPRTLVIGVRLQQAFHNVILNAIQQIAAQEGHESGWVEITSQYRPDDPAYPLRISITDNGPGIHGQNLEQVFALGYTTRRQEGTGLGLYITRGLIESIGGRIRITDSLILIGSTFLIELPLITQESPHA